MVSPIESGRRLLTNITSRKKAFVKGAMVVGGTAVAFSGIGSGIRIQGVEAQGPTPTPATDAINPVESTPAPNQVLLKNPNTGECVLVVFPNQTITPDTNPTPTPVADGQPVSANIEPTSGPTPAPELIAQAPGVDTAPLLEAQDDPTTWEPCVEGEKPTATLTAEPTVAPTEEPTSTPTTIPTTEPTKAPSFPPSPKATPVIENIINSEIPDKKPSTLAKIINNDLTKAYKEPDAESVWPKKLADIHWDGCQHDNKTTSHEFLNIELSCSALFITLYETFQKTQNIKFYKAALDVSHYALSVLPPKYQREFIESLRLSFPQG